MFKYLEKILGKTSSYYEMLMNSRKEHSAITSVQIDELVQRLEKVSTSCVYYQLASTQNNEFPVLENADWPTDPKLNPLPLVGKFETSSFMIELYVKTDIVTKDKRYQDIKVYPKHVPTQENNYLDATNNPLKMAEWESTPGKSVPIWEEIVHRFPEVNRFIKQTAPDNPWTFYKAARERFHRSDYKVQVGGYPQWLINDVDFRKIKKLEFLLEFKLQNNSSLYYFYDDHLNESVMISQKL